MLCPGVINTNIMYSNRNRPEALSDDPTSGDLTPEGKARADRIKRLAETEGMEPDELADMVFNAIRDEQFWILTHDDYDTNIRNRMEGILNRTTRSSPKPAAGSTCDFAAGCDRSAMQPDDIANDAL